MEALILGWCILTATGSVQLLVVVGALAWLGSLGQIPMRGRVMGIRMLAIWGLPLGLLAAGPIIASVGYAATTLIYAGLGLAATVAIGYRWRRALWHRSVAANSHL